MNQAPLAVGVAQEVSCIKRKETGIDGEVVIEDSGMSGTSNRTGSDEIVCFLGSEGTIGKTENRELGRYEVYVFSPQLKGGQGIAFIDSGSVVSLVKEYSVTRFRVQEHKIK